ncbi:MAG: hypothetical protein JWM76_2891 [Pseudonocardiales bacterium]|nr:hypothetical protein [Pseudonocardiales bacterium]
MNNAQITTSLDLARLAVSFAGQASLDSTRASIVSGTQAALNCAGASMWRRADRHDLRNTATTDPSLALLETTGGFEKLIWDVITTSRPAVSDDGHTDRNPPDFPGRTLSQTMMVSAAAFAVDIAGRDTEVLVAYSDTVGYFTSAVMELAQIIAMHASVALSKATMIAQIENLEIALRSNRRIGMAIGILMLERKVTEQQGFDLLRISSQRQNRKLHEVADELVRTGVFRSPNDANTAGLSKETPRTIRVTDINSTEV